MEGFSFADDKAESNATGTGNSNITEDNETEEKDGETEPKEDIVTEDKHDETEPKKNKQTEEKDGETEPKKTLLMKTSKLKIKTVKLNQKRHCYSTQGKFGIRNGRFFICR